MLTGLIYKLGYDLFGEAWRFGPRVALAGVPPDTDMFYEHTVAAPSEQLQDYPSMENMIWHRQCFRLVVSGEEVN
jgi:hypothetical protein